MKLRTYNIELDTFENYLKDMGDKYKAVIIRSDKYLKGLDGKAFVGRQMPSHQIRILVKYRSM